MFYKYIGVLAMFFTPNNLEYKKSGPQRREAPAITSGKKFKRNESSTGDHSSFFGLVVIVKSNALLPQIRDNADFGFMPDDVFKRIARSAWVHS